MSQLIRENVSLKPYNSFGFAVSARYFAELNAVEQLPGLVAFAQEKELPLIMIGGGSNLILTQDQHALVVINCLMGREVLSSDTDGLLIRAGAGEHWHLFVRWCIGQGCYGLENLSLIPGTVGAAPMQNIGAYGVEIKDRMHSLEAYDLETGEISVFACDECGFGYRDSIFKGRFAGRYLILSVTFRLSQRFEPVVHYGGIAGELTKRGIEKPSATQLSDIICEVRSSKLPDPAGIGNAGSFFKNPVINDAQAEALRQQYPELVCFPDRPGYTKLSAGWLIDQLGWKGRRQGDAGVYEKQALVLVNHGAATGRDILALAGEIQAQVFETYGVELEIEPRSYP